MRIQNSLHNKFLIKKKELHEHKQLTMQLSQEIEEAKKTPKTSNTLQQNVKQLKEMTKQEKMKFYFDMFSAGQSTTKTGGKRTGFGAWNDMPNGERSERCYPDSDVYCWSCRFDLQEDHLKDGGCSYKKYGHKDEATIENRMGGSTRNCFHHPNWATLKNS